MKKSFALVLALAMSLTGASALAAEKVTVRFGNTAGEDDIQSISLRDVAGRLAEATDGNFDAQVYLSSSLGDTDDFLFSIGLTGDGWKCHKGDNCRQQQREDPEDESVIQFHKRCLLS